MKDTFLPHSSPAHYTASYRDSRVDRLGGGQYVGTDGLKNKEKRTT